MTHEEKMRLKPGDLVTPNRNAEDDAGYAETIFQTVWKVEEIQSEDSCIDLTVTRCVIDDNPCGPPYEVNAKYFTKAEIQIGDLVMFDGEICRVEDIGHYDEHHDIHNTIYLVNRSEDLFEADYFDCQKIPPEMFLENDERDLL